MNYQKGGDPFAPSRSTLRLAKAAEKARGEAFAAFMASPLGIEEWMAACR